MLKGQGSYWSSDRYAYQTVARAFDTWAEERIGAIKLNRPRCQNEIDVQLIYTSDEKQRGAHSVNTGTGGGGGECARDREGLEMLRGRCGCNFIFKPRNDWTPIYARYADHVRSADLPILSLTRRFIFCTSAYIWNITHRCEPVHYTYTLDST